MILLVQNNAEYEVDLLSSCLIPIIEYCADDTK